MLDGQLPPHGDRPALIRPDGSQVTHAQLARAAAAGARSFAPGEAVAVAVADPAGFLVAALSAWEAGAAVVPVDLRASEAERARLLDDVGAAAVVWDASADGALAVERRAGRALDADIALVLSTSGSTGAPRRALLGRAGLWANVAAIRGYLPLHAGTRAALLVPLVHGYGLVGQALTTLQAGGALVLLGGLTYPAVQREAMARLGVNALSSVPTSLRLLAALDPLPLEFVASAGAALDAATRDALQAAFPGARRFNQYGLTEASPRVTQLSDAEAPFARGSVGRALPGLDLWIEGADGARLGPGQEGAICLRGPSVMRGYLGEPPLQGRLRTGDVGHLDAQGYLWVTGREDGLVKCGGERVSVDAVATVLRAAPGVADAAVVAVPDAALGARLVGYVVSSELAPVRAHLRAQLAPAARPRLVALAALPLLPSGKVDAVQLRVLATRAP